MYCACGIGSGAACELKSQYGHLRTHHGMCTYSDSGGSCSVMVDSPADWQTRAQLRDQHAQRLAAMAEAILLRRRQAPRR